MAVQATESPAERLTRLWTEDQARAKAQGYTIFGFPRTCRKCGDRGYHSSTANWMNRVVCLGCGAKWSE
jgi:hypothetical protein